MSRTAAKSARIVVRIQPAQASAAQKAAWRKLLAKLLEVKCERENQELE